MKVFFQFLAAIVLGILIARFAIPATGGAMKTSKQSNTQTAAASDNDEFQSLIDNLQQQLLDANKERRQLRQQLESLTNDSGGADVVASVIQDETEIDTVVADQFQQRIEQLRQNRNPANQQQRLLDAGFSETELSVIQQAEADRQEKLLDARLMAMRENPEEYEQQLDPFGYQPIREQLSDERFEDYLNALGRNTEVNARRVTPGSAADIAGIQSGDQIYSYDGSRIFQAGDVTRGTISGNLNEDVIIEVKRDGDLVTLSAPRGVLGVSLGGGGRQRGGPQRGGR